MSGSEGRHGPNAKGRSLPGHEVSRAPRGLARAKNPKTPGLGLDRQRWRVAAKPRWLSHPVTREGEEERRPERRG